MVGPGVNVIDELSIDDSILQRHLRIFMMRKEQALKFVVVVLAVNLCSVRQVREAGEAAHEIDRL